LTVAGRAPMPNAQTATITAPGEQTIEVTEATLTNELNRRFAGQSLGSTPLGQATLEHLDAQLRSGQMTATGNAQVGATNVPVSMSGHMDVESGHALVVVQDARAAGVPLPDSTRQNVQRALQDEVDRQLARSKLRVTAV